MLSFGTVWKLNPGWLTWRRERHNEGWESVGKGAQKYGRRENVYGKRETLTPLCPPTIFTTIYKASESFGHLNFPRIPVAPVKFVDWLLLLNIYQQSILQTEGYCRLWGISKDSPHCLVFTRFLFFSSSILARFHNCHNSSTRLIWKITSTES